MRFLPFFFLILLLGACATHLPPQEQIEQQSASEHMNNVALYAMSLADTPYRYGGNSSDSGFDCSGFVQHVYLNALGMKLPRTSTEMSRMGKEPADGQLHPGDLVFFNTRQRAFSHVGIYVGEERFIHSPSSGKAITITSMRENYWQNRYNGARRITSID